MINESAFQQTLDAIAHMPEGSTALDQARFVWEQCERACAPKVKALEWVSAQGRIDASTPFGLETVYVTRFEGSEGAVAYTTWGEDEFESVEAAKAAVQADYEKRILSALETRP